MTQLQVKVSQIGSVQPHGNADRLELATLTTSAYQFVVPKDEYVPGDLVLYYPLDAVLPDDLIAKIGLTGRLSGAGHNRVKTVKLRGEISQGIVSRPGVALSDWDTNPAELGTDVTERLGITKYEPPEVFQRDGNLISLPPMVDVYDLENAEGWQRQVEQLMDVNVVITEKLEGSHWGISVNAKDDVSVLQRRFKIKPNSDGIHVWHKVADDSGMHEKVFEVRDWVNDRLGHHYARGIETLTMRGELVGPGVQGNIYGLIRHAVYLFEIEVNGEPIDAEYFVEVCDDLQLRRVPVLSYSRQTLREWLRGNRLRDASNGYSVLAPNVRREGIVIKPLREMRDEKMGRLVVKQRSPIYLAGEA
jgi:RNA ligase (TIGR02306 family)